MPQTPDDLDAVAVRTWCSLALDALGSDREEIDAINVYPVADGDTGTNLYLTLESASQAVEAVFTGYGTETPETADVIRAMAHGALIGARGNSGTILAQLLRGMSEVLAEPRVERPGDLPGEQDHAGLLRRALRRAASSAYQAVAHPVEGTMLTVATAAADAAAATEGGSAKVARAAYDGARAALQETPGQLAVLGRAGVVDAGGRGLVDVLAALVGALSGETPAAQGRGHGIHVVADDCAPDLEVGGPAFEVIYLLEAGDGAVARLRTRLDGLGDSLVVVGGDGLWNVHVHVDDAGAAIEAGVEAGRPYRIRITHFAAAAVEAREQIQRAVVAVVPGEGLAELCTEAGATTVLARPPPYT
ncbi:DAK2 domain-containing protein, partial [Streptomyces beijiangensis]